MYQKIKEEMKDIISIVKECPESLQEKCFELMLGHLLKEVKQNKPAQMIEETHDERKQVIVSMLKEKEDKTNGDSEIVTTDFHLKTRNFLKTNTISIDLINKLYYKEDGKILPLYEDLGTTKMAENQIRLALLTAFENSFEHGDMMVFDGEIVRKKCQDLKCYDSNNFTTNFVNSAILFDEFEKYQKGVDIKLSQEGKKELSRLIIKLSELT